ncbi:MAG: efflux RND transporter periplasmic adaptor subunit [Candidatus Falkowbacteria bacterium]
MNKPKLFTLLMLLAGLTLAGCGTVEKPKEETKDPLAVKTQLVKNSHTAVNQLDYPGTVVSESEAKLVAKASGNAKGANFKVGDKVSAGQELLRIDDFSDVATAGFNSAQIKSAVIGVNQAQANFDLAKKNYDNLVLSSGKDLRAAEIAKDQSLSSQSNLTNTTAEALKSIELAYETAKTASESARLNLENKRKQLAQGTGDTYHNIDTGADAIVDSAGALLSQINSAGGYDDNNSVNVPYASVLGAMDSSVLNITKDNYRSTKNLINAYLNNTPSNTAAKVDAAIKIAEATKKLAQGHKITLDKSVSSTALSPASLSGFQAAASGYLSQANGLLSQANGFKQNLDNLGLNNDSLIDSLTKAYELAKKQEAQSAQALASLKAGNTSQQDQAGFMAQSAGNNFDNIKVKINTQLVGAKTQLDMAEMSYKNAQINLQSLYDNRQVISPISGFVTKKSIAEGDAVTAGQVLASVSQTDNVKIQFYLDQENLAYLTAGQSVQIKSGDKTLNGIISAISPQADPLTKRYLAEVKPEDAKPGDLSLGSIVSVSVEIKHGASGGKNIILPLEAITIGQNENYIYQLVDGKAKKIPVQVGAVSGEFAEVKTDLPADAQVVVSGSRLLSDGQDIIVK